MTPDEQDVKAGRKRKAKAVPGAPVPSAEPAPVTATSRRVRATRIGQHGHTLRRVGDVFHIGANEKLGSWMEAWPDGATDNGDDGDDAPADAANVPSSTDHDVL